MVRVSIRAWRRVLFDPRLNPDLRIRELYESVSVMMRVVAACRQREGFQLQALLIGFIFANGVEGINLSVFEI